MDSHNVLSFSWSEDVHISLDDIPKFSLYFQNQRIPADVVLLRTSEKSGTCFIRTDQLDGETDWKLRLPIQCTQKFENDHEVFEIDGRVYAEKPQKDIHSFIGRFTSVSTSSFCYKLSKVGKKLCFSYTLLFSRNLKGLNPWALKIPCGQTLFWLMVLLWA